MTGRRMLRSGVLLFVVGSSIVMPASHQVATAHPTADWMRWAWWQSSLTIAFEPFVPLGDFRTRIMQAVDWGPSATGRPGLRSSMRRRLGASSIPVRTTSTASTNEGVDGPGGLVIAQVRVCKDSSGAEALGAEIRFDWDETWATEQHGPDEEGEQDLEGAATHEMGHVYGWFGHFSGTACPSGLPGQTMCGTQLPGDSWMRTTEVHDNHTLADAYQKDLSFHLRNTNTSGAANITGTYGNAKYRPLVGDWNGDGVDTIGVYGDGSYWYMRNSNTPGSPDISLSYGSTDYYPVVGDWDGDGVDTPGLFDRIYGNWYLRNSWTPGPPDLTFTYGAPRDFPIAGDWNNDGIDTIGVFDQGVWSLRNTNNGGPPDISVVYQASDNTPTRSDLGPYRATGTETARTPSACTRLPWPHIPLP